MKIAKKSIYTYTIEEGERRGREKEASRRVMCERFVEPTNHLPSRVFKFVAGDNLNRTISHCKIQQYLKMFLFILLLYFDGEKKERKGKRRGRGWDEANTWLAKVILLYRQMTSPIGIGARLRIVARATDVYNLTHTQKEWASPGSKLTVIDRAGWFYWLNKSNRSFFRRDKSEGDWCEIAKRWMRRCAKKFNIIFFCKCNKKKNGRKERKASEEKKYECDRVRRAIGGKSMLIVTIVASCDCQRTCSDIWRSRSAVVR